MSTVSRLEIHRSAEIGAAADEIWGLICDWAGMLRWWLSPEQGGLAGPALVGCELRGGDTEVPRTRQMRFDNGLLVGEEVLYQNNDTRRIYYNKTADRDVSGYLATTYVDPLDETTSRVHICSALDVHHPAHPAAVTAKFEAIYAAMFEGYHRYFEAAAGKA